MAPKPQLVRLALQPPAARHSGPSAPRVVLDSAGLMPGRGSYLCAGDRPGAPSAACLQRAVRRGGLNRAFRTAVTIDHDFVESTV